MKNRPYRSFVLSFSTLGCPKLSWEAAAGLAVANGFAGVELRALRGRIDLPVLLAEEFGTPEAMARTCVASGVKVVALDASMRLLGAKEEHRVELEALAVWADALGIPYLRVFDGGENGDGARSEVRRQMLDELDRWQRWREEKGISCELMVETHWALTDPKDCLRLGKESGGRLTLLWDIGHTWNRRWVAPHEDWPMLKPLVRHIHIKDAVKDTTTPKGLKHVLPGSGEMPVVPLLEALDRDGFSGPVSLEWECFWNPEMPPLEEALASGRRHGWWA